MLKNQMAIFVVAVLVVVAAGGVVGLMLGKSVTGKRPSPQEPQG